MGDRVIHRKSQPVEITGVDSSKLDKDMTFKDAYAFYIKLSGEPDYIWQAQLAKWDSALASMSRKISVEKDRLRLVFVYGDNVQLYTDYASSLVNWVNERIAEHNKKIEALEKEEARQKQITQTKEEYLLQELKKVKPEPAISSSEMTIKKLLAAYENDSTEYEKYRNSILKLKGFVNTIEQNCIFLADTYKAPKGVLCVFDKGHTYELKKLRTGQMITVTGEFEGSVVQVSMRHCSLVT
jgi:wobble nucleotide-excising tRNase